MRSFFIPRSKLGSEMITEWKKCPIHRNWSKKAQIRAF